MPAPDTKRHRYWLTSRIASLWMVVLALGLAVIGAVLAIQHARSLAYRLMSEAEVQAGRIAEDARERFGRELLEYLTSAAAHLRDHPGKPWRAASSSPSWIDGLFIWDGQEFTVADPPREAPGGLGEHVKLRITSRPLPLLKEIGDPHPQLFYDSLDSEPVVLACLATLGSADQPVLLAAHIDIQRIKRDLLDPLVGPSSGLELVPTGLASGPWVQPLYSAMRYWVIRPTAAFVQQQQRTVLGQTLYHVGLTVLAIGTLLIAMWLLVRLSRREMALVEMKANFVADVSHELKTPLALIRMFAETLQSGRISSDEKRQEYYEIITRESTRLTHLIDNILDFARIDAGRKEYHLEPIDVVEVVRNTYDTYRSHLEHCGFEHHFTVSPAVPQVDADPGAIAQALINLITNSIKYSSDERYIAIDVSPDTRRGKHGALISVHDRGIGIRPEDRAHLFDGFFRSSDRRVREKGGAGLGLGLVKHIVDSHNGMLDVESRLVKGSTFRIFLPASEHSGGETAGTVPDEA